MQNATLWRALLGVEKTVVEDVEFDEDEQLLVAHVRPRSRARARARCGRCERRAPAYDRGEGRRRWRALDLGTVHVVLEAEAPRVDCSTHGPTVAVVPWARHASGHTRVFDDQVAWLATQCSKTAITELMRIAWRTVGAIITSRPRPDPARSMLRIHGHLIEPCALAEPQRIHVEVDGAEADYLAVKIGDESGTARGIAELGESFARCDGTP